MLHHIATRPFTRFTNACDSHFCIKVECFPPYLIMFNSVQSSTRAFPSPNVSPPGRLNCQKNTTKTNRFTFFFWYNHRMSKKCLLQGNHCFANKATFCFATVGRKYVYWEAYLFDFSSIKSNSWWSSAHKCFTKNTSGYNGFLTGWGSGIGNTIVVKYILPNQVSVFQLN